jgi:non-structural maintenance of chromosomes element 4
VNMAPHNVQSSSSGAESDQDSSVPPTSRRVTSETSASPSLSDKENQARSEDAGSRGAKRKPTTGSMSTSSLAASGSSIKKRKIGDGNHTLPSQAVHRRELEERVDKQFYDPDQDHEERRATRKGMRDLAKELNGMNLCSHSWKVNTNYV